MLLLEGYMYNFKFYVRQVLPGEQQVLIELATNSGDF
jgi:hypothetical protein